MIQTLQNKEKKKLVGTLEDSNVRIISGRDTSSVSEEVKTPVVEDNQNTFNMDNFETSSSISDSAIIGKVSCYLIRTTSHFQLTFYFQLLNHTYAIRPRFVNFWLHILVHTVYTRCSYIYKLWLKIHHLTNLSRNWSYSYISIPHSSAGLYAVSVMCMNQNTKLSFTDSTTDEQSTATINALLESGSNIM